MRSVARKYGVSLCMVRWWVRRAWGLALDRVDWSNRPPVPKRMHRTEAGVEDLVLTLRRDLKERSDLGEFGARAIHRELIARGRRGVPSVRTIGRILERRGALDGRRRIRRPPPPRGWYLPEVAQGRAEVDSFDIIEGLALQGGLQIEVLTVISLHGGLPGAWPQSLVTAKIVVERLVEHWQEFGVPLYAQFDNDTIFQGGHHGQDSIGRVMRTCLGLDVTPVFVPPHESGFQAAIENFNGRWQAKVWTRFHHDTAAALQERSRRYVTALCHRAAERIEAAPQRRPFPDSWHPDLQGYPQGRIIFMRRTSEHGSVSLLGHTFEVDPVWPHRLVRCEVHLSADTIRFYALRRREPTYHPLLRELPYVFPRKPFHE